MRTTLLTLSALLGLTLATPVAPLQPRQTSFPVLTFYTFKDITGNTWSVYCTPGQDVEQILGPIPGGPYICGAKQAVAREVAARADPPLLKFWIFTDTAGVSHAVYCTPGQDVEKLLGDLPGGPYICPAN